MRKKEKMSGNRGFSLVEVVVTMAMLSSVMVVLFYFMQAGVGAYTRNDRHVTAQAKSQFVLAQVREIYSQCSGGVTQVNNGGETKYYILNKNPEELRTIYLHEGTLYLSENRSGLSESGNDQILCEDVLDFSIDVIPNTSRTKAKSAKVSIRLIYDRSEYTRSTVVTFNNSPLYADGSVTPLNDFINRIRAGS